MFAKGRSRESMQRNGIKMFVSRCIRDFGDTFISFGFKIKLSPKMQNVTKFACLHQISDHYSTHLIKKSSPANDQDFLAVERPDHAGDDASAKSIEGVQ